MFFVVVMTREMCVNFKFVSVVIFAMKNGVRLILNHNRVSWSCKCYIWCVV